MIFYKKQIIFFTDYLSCFESFKLTEIYQGNFFTI